ncbi:MAG: hypothetical protein QME68_07225 [Elusimicrobiota bacterium]|nr:hypothetical protein [Elusimicrobiota bacterium]
MIFVILKFLIVTGIIFFAGKRVAKYGDVIAQKTGLGGVWIGGVLVACITSLPEIFTGVGSVVFVDAPDLTVGNVFGANAYTLFNIALLDFLNKNTPLLSNISQGQILTAQLSLLIVFVAIAGIFFSRKFTNLSFANISIFSIFILITYIISARKIFTFEKTQQMTQAEISRIADYEHISLKKTYIYFALSSVAIVIAGIWLAYIGDELSEITTLGKNFIGYFFISLSTTLPEITVSISALLLGAKELSVANMLGSNMFNVLIIFIDDLLYPKAPILSVVSTKHIFTACVVCILTVIVISGLVTKPKKKAFLNLSSYAICLIIVFLAGSYANFVLNR